MSPSPSTGLHRSAARRLSAAVLAAAVCLPWANVGAATTTTAQLPVALSASTLAKLSAELQPLATAPWTVPAASNWSKTSNNQVYVKVLIVAASTDANLASLRADVLARGGSVFYNYVSVRALAALVPSSALAPLATRSDVVQIAPNHTVERHASLLQSASDAGSLVPAAPSTGLPYDGTGVAIAVLDSGIDFRHRNMQSASGATRVQGVVDVIAMSRSVIGDGWSTGKDYSSNVKSAQDIAKLATKSSALKPGSGTPDPYGHGTAVASVAAGRGAYQSPDSSGIAPGASLYDIRVLDEQGIGTEANVLLGIDWVIQAAKLANIRVMNLSLGADSTSSFLVDPIARAARSAVASGIVVVAAAGNAGKDSAGSQVHGTVSSPGDDPSVITVGASNAVGSADRSDDLLTTFSSRGPTRGTFRYTSGSDWTDNLVKPDLVAPGNKLLVALGADSSGLPKGWNALARTYPQLTQVPGASQTTRQTLMTLSGTSVAAPAVAGAAAVMLQANPGLTPPLVKAILQYTATPLANASLIEQGTGELNVEAAVRLARVLRTDIATALATGKLKAGDPLLATGQTLPAPYSTVAGRVLPWSAMATVGGTHLVSGDALFTRFQPVWDPALTWARGYVLRDSVSYQAAGGSIPANTVPAAVVERNAAAQSLLTSGVRLLDSVALSISGESAALATTPVATLVSRAQSGKSYMLGSGASFNGYNVVADGFTLTSGFVLNATNVPLEGMVFGDGILLGNGFVLNEGFVLREGFVLNEGFVLREGFILNEGFLLRESGGGDPAGGLDASLVGD